MSLSINNKLCHRIHFIGIYGSGMSALAQFCCWMGLKVTGSDRLRNNKEVERIHTNLISIGCQIFPQDGSGVDPSTDFACISSAIEENNPDIRATRQLSVPVVHRSDVLAAIVASRTTIAVAGTSGKSTVTAMIFELLFQCNKSPSLITGANLKRLEQMNLIGNAYYGKSDLLVVEADESDGSLVKYHPSISVILNVSKDHKPVHEVIELFKTLAHQSEWVAANKDDPQLANISPVTKWFGFGSNADYYPDKIEEAPLSSTVFRHNKTFHLPIPGKHNISNLIAALCVCEHVGCFPDALAAASKNYLGVSRRFSIKKSESGVTIIDDFAHNPEKIRAAITTARNISSRLFVLFQPHGFGPTRFLRNEFVDVFRSCMRENDTLFLLPIYYAGGTAQQDISSEDLAKQSGTTVFTVIAPHDKAEALRLLSESSIQPSDAVLVMGARDPSLPSFVDQIAITLDNCS